MGSGPVSAVHADPSGVVYFSRGGQLFRKESGRTVEFGRPRGLPADETLDDIRTDGEGRLWVRTVKRLYLLPRGAQRFERDDKGLPESSEIGRLAIDDLGRVLVPTVQGLASRDGGLWRLIGRREGLPVDTALAAIVDREGSLWVGLLGGGLARRLGHGQITNWSASDGLSHDVVWSITRQKTRPGPGPVWVGTEQGLNRIDPDDRSDPALFRGRRPRGQRRQRARLRRGRQRLGGIVARRRHPHCAGRPPPPPRRRGRARPSNCAWRRSTCVPTGRSGSEPSTASTVSRPAPAPTGSSASRSAATSPTTCAPSPRIRPGSSTPPASRGSSGSMVPLPGASRVRDGLREDFVSSIAFASDGSLVIAYREVDRRRQGDPPGRSPDRAAHRRRDGAGLQQGRARRARRGRATSGSARARESTSTARTGR